MCSNNYFSLRGKTLDFFFHASSIDYRFLDVIHIHLYTYEMYMYIFSYVCKHIYIPYICSKENFSTLGQNLFQIYTYCLLLNAICFSHDLKKYTTTRFFFSKFEISYHFACIFKFLVEFEILLPYWSSVSNS